MRFPPHGLSPRVRGNQPLRAVSPLERGSIPARAGEPGAGGPGMPSPPVYPRACGGTSMVMSPKYIIPGLSPRVRGNPGARHLLVPLPGSIPARAGEPTDVDGWANVVGVYPRACGGTDASNDFNFVGRGLSPRVRGNRRQQRLQLRGPGSIPARAGEPPQTSRAKSRYWVYPRACGGTQAPDTFSYHCPGLSPRVRGNPGGMNITQFAIRSIPARAGEPPETDSPRRASKVYPRACGGTSPSSRKPLSSRGLSPRVRGNRTGRGVGR